MKHPMHIFRLWFFLKWNQMTRTNRTLAKICYNSTLICFDLPTRCASEYIIERDFKHDCSPLYLSIWGLHRVASPPAVGLLQNLVCETVAFSLSSSLSLWSTTTSHFLLFQMFQCWDVTELDMTKWFYRLQALMV